MKPKREYCPRCFEPMRYYDLPHHNAIGADCCGLWFFQRLPYRYVVRNPAGQMFRGNDLPRLIDEAFHKKPEEAFKCGPISSL